MFQRLILLSILASGAAGLSWHGRGHGGGFEGDEDEVPFDEAELYFELNDTDGDLGIHSKIDGDEWKNITMEDPHGRELLYVSVKGRMRKQGLTELFFESAEPSFDELEPDTFLRRFPEGEYEIEGVTLEGEEMESVAVVTHLLPAPPSNVRVSGIPAAENCDAEILPVVPEGEPVVIRWDPVTLSHPEIGRTGEPIEVVRYQLVVEREEPTLLVFSLDLPPEVTEVEVPESFIELADAFKFEIIVREASGNQTAVESCFEID